MSAAEKALAALEEELSDLRPRVWTGAAAEIIMPVASPLAAVARAAMARPWWIRDINLDDGTPVFMCQVCGSMAEGSQPRTHLPMPRGACEMADIDAALDALEAAAEGVL